MEDVKHHSYIPLGSTCLRFSSSLHQLKVIFDDLCRIESVEGRRSRFAKMPVWPLAEPQDTIVSCIKSSGVLG